MTPMIPADTTAPHARRVPVRVLLLLLVAWGLLTFRLGAPWFGVQDAYRVWVPAAVRNYDLYGVEGTRLLVTRDSAPVDDPADLTYYSHHPPLIAWVPAALTQVFGFHELGVRYGFAAASLVSIAALYVLARRLFDARVAWWAAAFYGLVPMVAYMGRVPGHDPLGIMAGLLFGAVLVNWLRRPARIRWLALAGLAWLAVWTAWPGVFMVGWLGLAAFWLGSDRHRFGVVGLGLVSVVAFVLLMGYYEVAWPGAVESLLDAYVWRSSSASSYEGTAAFTAGEFVAKLLLDVFVLVTPGVLVLSVAGVPMVRRTASRPAQVMLLALFLAGLSYQLVFRNASYIHDYYKLFLVPAMAISAGVLVVRARFTRPVHRLARPLVDSMLLTALILGAIVFGVLHLSNRQPEIRATIDALQRTARPEDTLVVDFNFPDYGPSSGTDRVIEFYLLHDVTWGLRPSAVLALVEGDTGAGTLPATERVLYVYCEHPAHEMTSAEAAESAELDLLAGYPQEALPGTDCRLYTLEAAAAAP